VIIKIDTNRPLFSIAQETFIIFDPKINAITSPFFSRKEAEMEIRDGNYSKKAKVMDKAEKWGILK